MYYFLYKASSLITRSQWVSNNYLLENWAWYIVASKNKWIMRGMEVLLWMAVNFSGGAMLRALLFLSCELSLLNKTICFSIVFKINFVFKMQSHSWLNWIKGKINLKSSLQGLSGTGRWFQFNVCILTTTSFGLDHRLSGLKGTLKVILLPSSFGA